MRVSDRTIMLPSLGLALVLEGGRVDYRVQVSRDGQIVAIRALLSAKHGGVASWKLVNCAPNRLRMSQGTSLRK